ncbi:MAG: enoyl-CoA hydratase/isomerase family protein [Rubrivivax sp.]
MSGEVRFVTSDAHGVVHAVIHHAGKQNALSMAMWQQLRAGFEQLKADSQARVVVLSGDGAHFAAGGDIAEFPLFRFDEDQLRRFHEVIVAPALRALLDCELPLLAAIEGSCIGGGLEIAACCDLRIAARGSRYGIPIARLGFPLAPSEAQIVHRMLGDALLRELLLEARLLPADEALARGIVSRIVDDGQALTEAMNSARRIAELSPQAHRLNKQTLAQIAAGGPSAAQRDEHFSYADSAEHREGLAAFSDKRPARF